MEQASYSPASADAVLRFQQQRIVTALFREYLMLLEDLGNAHDEALDKLVRALPAEYGKFVDLADYLTPEKGQLLRKRVLDRGNDSLRALEELTRNFKIDFK